MQEKATVVEADPSVAGLGTHGENDPLSCVLFWQICFTNQSELYFKQPTYRKKQDKVN